MAQDAIVRHAGNLDDIRGSNLQLEASNDAPKWGVVFIRRYKGTIESRNHPYVHIFWNPQEIILPLELEDIEDFWKSNEVLQLKTRSSSNWPPKEVILKVGLHLLVFKNI